MGEDGSFLTIYSPYHIKIMPELEDVEVIAVKIARDGTPIYL